MQIQERRLGGVMVIHPEVTQLNAPVAPEFRKQVAAIVERGERNLVLDLSGVEFIDSTALGAIVAILKLVDPAGHLALCCAGPTVRAMLDVTRMTRIFPLHADVESACAALADAAS
jgi:anti-sigma B factor antagonist